MNKKLLVDLAWYIGSILFICLIIAGWIYNYYYSDSASVDNYSNDASENWAVDPVTGQAIPN